MASDFIGEKLESNDVLIDLPLVMEPPLRPGCCIYRVPKNLCKINKAASTPKLVSGGPFHYCLKELRDMEKHKLRYFKDFLFRTRKSQEDLLRIIQDNCWYSFRYGVNLHVPLMFFTLLNNSAK